MGQVAEQITRWEKQVDEVTNQLYRGFLHQDVWTQVRDEVQHRHPAGDGTFLVCYSGGYVAGQLTLIRRLADQDRKSMSLHSLIERILVNPRVMTRDQFALRYAASVSDDIDGDFHAVGLEVWEQHYADPRSPNQINPAMLQRDLTRLATELEHMTTWATKTIAHLDPRTPERVPQYHEIRSALDLLAEMTNTYRKLLCRPWVAMWTPAIQGDWQRVLRPGLFRSDPERWSYPNPQGYT